MGPQHNRLQCQGRGGRCSSSAATQKMRMLAPCALAGLGAIHFALQLHLACTVFTLIILLPPTDF